MSDVMLVMMVGKNLRQRGLPLTAVTGYEESRQLLVDFLTVSLKANLNVMLWP